MAKCSLSLPDQHARSALYEELPLFERRSARKALHACAEGGCSCAAFVPALTLCNFRRCSRFFTMFTFSMANSIMGRLSFPGHVNTSQRAGSSDMHLIGLMLMTGLRNYQMGAGCCSAAAEHKVRVHAW